MNKGLWWVKGPWPGKLAVAARPRGGDWLEDEIANWRREGIRIVVSLLTPEEEREFQIERESADARAQGITFLGLPIRDRQTPDSESDMQSAVQQLDDTLASGQNVLVHCRQGIGRSGLLAACLLVNRGWSPEAAMKELSEVRGVSVPETRQQHQWIDQYAAKVKAANLHAEPPLESAGRRKL